ncbi:hypothetical protein [Streptomyces sp. NPDC059008]|uniref:hypothetical protein n=1 Tax=Streptomyces sp. NPDC059008 TaxID=3346693 RepID=UPI00369838A2
MIVPGRYGNGFRDYCQSTIDRVLVIRSLLESGLPVRLIREVLPGLTDPMPAPMWCARSSCTRCRATAIGSLHESPFSAISRRHSTPTPFPSAATSGPTARTAAAKEVGPPASAHRATSAGARSSGRSISSRASGP